MQALQSMEHPERRRWSYDRHLGRQPRHGVTLVTWGWGLGLSGRLNVEAWASATTSCPEGSLLHLYLLTNQSQMLIFKALCQGLVFRVFSVQCLERAFFKGLRLNVSGFRVYRVFAAYSSLGLSSTRTPTQHLPNRKP